jgi:protein-tyrosine phosphatase
MSVQPIRICFVCLGNICRSPTAEGVMKMLVQERGYGDRIVIESAGTGDYHVGEPADRRSSAAAKARGVLLDGKAKQFRSDDFDRFDYVIAMDRRNFGVLKRMARSPEEAARVLLLRSFDPESVRAKAEDVPDPYFEDNFDEVFDICKAGCTGLLTSIVQRHGL